MRKSRLCRPLFGVCVVILVGLMGCNQSGEAPTSPSAVPGAGGAVGPTAGSGGNSGGSGDPSGSGGGGDGGGSGDGGRLVVKLTDLPVSDATALLATFSDVSVHQSGGDWITISEAARTCDLLRLQDGVTDDLGVALLDAGHYTQVSVTVESAEIFFGYTTAGNPACAPAIADDGTGIAVEVASGVVRLNRQFTVPEGGITTMLLDFDANRSVREIGAGNSNAPMMGPPDHAGPPEDPGPPDDPGNPNNGDGENGPSRYIMTPVIAVVSVD